MWYYKWQEKSYFGGISPNAKLTVGTVKFKSLIYCILCILAQGSSSGGRSTIYFCTPLQVNPGLKFLLKGHIMLIIIIITRFVTGLWNSWTGYWGIVGVGRDCSSVGWGSHHRWMEVAMMESSVLDLQHSLERFTAQREVAGMTIKSESMVRSN